MNNLNSILIEGNMVKDPVLEKTENGNNVCNFTVASNRFYKNNEGMEKEVGFFDVECWSKLAIASKNKGYKGRGVRIVGRLKQSRWVSADGKNCSRISIVAEHLEFRPDFTKKSDIKKEKVS